MNSYRRGRGVIGGITAAVRFLLFALANGVKPSATTLASTLTQTRVTNASGANAVRRPARKTVTPEQLKLFLFHYLQQPARVRAYSSALHSNYLAYLTCRANGYVANAAQPTSSTVRLGRCSIPSRSLSFTDGDKLEKHSRMLSITDTVSREAMLGGVHSSSVDPNLL